MNSCVGVDIGGTKIAAGLVDERGVISGRVSARTSSTADDVVAATISLVRGLIEHVTPAAIGIGSPGTVDRFTGVVVASDSKPALAGMPIGPEVGEAFDLPFAVTNDVNAAGVAELAFGAAQGFDRALLVSVGTGVGAALLVDGRIEEGLHGTTGEIAHLLVGEAGPEPCGCGRADHLEAVASGPAIERAYAAQSGRALPLDQIATRADEGDVGAEAVIRSAASWLGRAVAGFASALDIDALLLRGGVASIGKPYLDAVESAFRAEVISPLRQIPVLTAALGDDGPIVGAATYVRARLGLA